jgi:copper(I)-binding protein
MTAARAMPRLIAGVLLLAAAAAADAPPASPIAIRDAWARATPSGAKTGATYGTLVNAGASDDRLVGVSTPVAERAQLHAHVDAAGVMRMEPQSSIELTAGTSTVLAPGGRHIMLFGLKRPLKPGESFPLDLTFQKAGTVRVEVTVQQAGAMGADGAAPDGRGMK